MAIPRDVFPRERLSEISTPATALAAASYIGVWVQIVFLFGHGKFRRKKRAI
jgi:hypothetical protein